MWHLFGVTSVSTHPFRLLHDWQIIGQVTRLGIASEAGIPAASFVIVRRLSIMMRHRDPILATRRVCSRSCSYLRHGFISCAEIELARRSFHMHRHSSYSYCFMWALWHFALIAPKPHVSVKDYVQVAQANRFEIIEEVGCLNATGTSVLAVLLVNIIPISFPILSLTLYSRTFSYLYQPIILIKLKIARLVWFYFKRGELGEILASSSHFDRRSFIKVLALGLFDIFITLPLTVYDLVQNFSPGGITTFWPGWKIAHSEISSVPTITSVEWKSAGPLVVSSIIINEWINPLFAIVFFALFGLTENNRLWYCDLFRKITKCLGFTPRLQPVAPSDIVFVSVPMPIDSNEVHTEIKWVYYYSFPSARESYSTFA